MFFGLRRSQVGLFCLLFRFFLRLHQGHDRQADVQQNDDDKKLEDRKGIKLESSNSADELFNQNNSDKLS